MSVSIKRTMIKIKEVESSMVETQYDLNSVDNRHERMTIASGASGSYRTD
jgi:hypothetical protein